MPRDRGVKAYPKTVHIYLRTLPQGLLRLLTYHMSAVYEILTHVVI